MQLFKLLNECHIGILHIYSMFIIFEPVSNNYKGGWANNIGIGIEIGLSTITKEGYA